MANTLSLTSQILGAPYEVKASFTGTAMSGGDFVITRKYAVLAGTWATREEHDGFYFTPLNFIQSKWGLSTTMPVAYETGAWNILNDTVGKKLLVSWALPKHCGKIDHISVYIFRGDVDPDGAGAAPIPDITTNDFLGAAFTKVLPDVADMTLLNGEIPPYATSVTIKTAVGVTRKRRVPIISGTLSTKTIVVPGNISHSLPGSGNTTPGGVSGAAGVVIGDGAGGAATTTVGAATRSVTAGEGEITTITVGSFGTIAGDFTDAGYLEYDCGPIKLATSDGMYWTSDVTLITDLPYSNREKFMPDYKGDMVESAYLGDNDIDKLSFSCAYPGISAADHYDINKALRGGLRVHAVINQDSDVTRFPASFDGYIRETNDLGLRNMHETGRRAVYDFLPDRQHDLWEDDGFYAVVIEAGGIPGTGNFEVKGDKTKQFASGQAFYFSGSVDNTGLWRSGNAPVYSQASDTTVIYVTNKTTVGAVTATGWLQLVAL